MKNTEKNFYITLWCVLAVVLVFVTTVKISGIDVKVFLYPCLFHELTGYYCPGCGGTRAAEALLSGHLIRSFVYHPIVIYTAILLGWFMVTYTMELLAKHQLKYRFPFKPAWLWIALAIVIVNCLIKNLLLGCFGIALI